MKIKKQIDTVLSLTAEGGFEVVDRTDEVSNRTTGKAKLTWFEEIFEVYQLSKTN
ncbi:chlorohydrolase [Streptococcus pneumoniae]|nr:chlorohydrolase [Streptococcus pneumoniae]